MKVRQHVVAAESPASSHSPRAELAFPGKAFHIMRADLQESGNFFRAKDVFACILDIGISQGCVGNGFGAGQGHSSSPYMALVSGAPLSMLPGMSSRFCEPVHKREFFLDNRLATEDHQEYTVDEGDTDEGGEEQYKPSYQAPPLDSPSRDRKVLLKIKHLNAAHSGASEKKMRRSQGLRHTRMLGDKNRA